MRFIVGKQYKYTVIFEPAEEGGYVVHVPALEGLVTEGDTLKEAKAMAKDAILCHLEGLKKIGAPIPLEHFQNEPHFEKMAVAL